MLRDSLDGRGIWGRMDAGTCTAEPFHSSPESITTLIAYTSIQKKILKKEKIEKIQSVECP